MTKRKQYLAKIKHGARLHFMPNSNEIISGCLQPAMKRRQPAPNADGEAGCP